MVGRALAVRAVHCSVGMLFAVCSGRFWFSMKRRIIATVIAWAVTFVILLGAYWYVTMD